VAMALALGARNREFESLRLEILFQNTSCRLNKIMNVNYYIQCTSCKQNIKKWKYEIDLIKDKNKYICKQCTYINSKEERTCPVCKTAFQAFKKHKKTTCSRSCANKYFRVGESNGNWKKDSYRSTCFLHHKKKCVVCDETKIVAVHHYNGDHNDNRIENLVPLCPTHHQYMHSGYRSDIEPIVDEYISSFVKQCSL
jgi:hypothetical protein